jgi:hypothetical protein
MMPQLPSPPVALTAENGSELAAENCSAFVYWIKIGPVGGGMKAAFASPPANIAVKSAVPANRLNDLMLSPFGQTFEHPSREESKLYAKPSWSKNRQPYQPVNRPRLGTEIRPVLICKFSRQGLSKISLLFAPLATTRRGRNNAHVAPKSTHSCLFPRMRALCTAHRLSNSTIPR